MDSGRAVSPARRFSPAELEQARAAQFLPGVIARRVKLRHHGTYWQGLCPFHGERTPSFTVYPDHYFCFGCGAKGTLIDWYIQAGGMDFREAVESLIGSKGSCSRFEQNMKRATQEYLKRPSEADEGRVQAARDLFFAAQSASGTLVETYFRHRGIRLKPPQSVRFMPELHHHESGRAWPAMISGIQDGCGSDGLGKIAYSPSKKTLGLLFDGAVRLSRPSHELGIAEGVETGQSCRQIYSVPVWASLGTRQAKISIPKGVQHLFIFGDNGGPGHAAAEAAARTYVAAGRTVEVIYPPKGYGDFNDVLTGRKQVQTEEVG